MSEIAAAAASVRPVLMTGNGQSQITVYNILYIYIYTHTCTHTPYLYADNEWRRRRRHDRVYIVLYIIRVCICVCVCVKERLCVYVCDGWGKENSRIYIGGGGGVRRQKRYIWHGPLASHTAHVQPRRPGRGDCTHTHSLQERCSENIG